MAHYNIGAESEYLQRFDEALVNYQKGYEFALKHLGPNNQLTENLFNSLMQSNKRNGAINNLVSMRQTKRELGRVISHSISPSIKSRKAEILDNMTRLNTTALRKSAFPKVKSRKRTSPGIMSLNQSYTNSTPTAQLKSCTPNLMDKRKMIEVGIGGTRKYLDASRRLKMYCGKIIN